MTSRITQNVHRKVSTTEMIVETKPSRETMNINKLWFPWKPAQFQLGTISENACLGVHYQFAKFHACIKKYTILLKFRVMPPDYFFEVWPVGLIFFFFTRGGCTCFYEEKTKIIARATRANYKTAVSLKIYLLFAQQNGLHLTQLI